MELLTHIQPAYLNEYLALMEAGATTEEAIDQVCNSNEIGVEQLFVDVYAEVAA